MESELRNQKSFSRQQYVVATGIILLLAATGTLVFSNLVGVKSPKLGTTAIQREAPALDTLEKVILSNSSVVRNGVALVKVESRTFTSQVTTIGVLEIPEPGERTISAWARGRIQQLHVAATGMYIRAGEPLYDIYSPDILNAEEEYLIAKTEPARGGTNNSMPNMPVMGATDPLTKSSRERLLLYGLTEQQIDELHDKNSLINTVTITAPTSGFILQKLVQEGAYVEEGSPLFDIADLSTVWAELQIPQSQLNAIHLGQILPLTMSVYPERIFDGTVILISPVGDQTSRTVRVRLALRNNQYELRPGLTFSASISLVEGTALAVPQNAVIHTGRGDFVWVHESGNTFTSRQVTLGALSSDDYYQVFNGLSADDNVAAQGAFLVDAEYQFTKNNPMAGMNMGETGSKNSGVGMATVRAIDAAGQTITLDHGSIPGVMPAMTMGYRVSDPKFLTSVQVGESVRFTLTRRSDGTFEISAIGPS